MDRHVRNGGSVCIDSDPCQGRSAAGRGVRVAVIDSGWDRRQYEPQIESGVGLVDSVDEFRLNKSNDDHDRIGHGTACTRIILDRVPGAQIVPIRVFDHVLETSIPVLAAALEVAVERRVHIINLSLATSRRDAIVPLYAACERAARDGVIIVASSKPTSNPYPASFENVIGVEASEFCFDAEVYLYRSNAAIECAAPGCPVNPRPSNHRTIAVAHSYATARITGLLALFKREYPTANISGARRWLSEQFGRSQIRH
jgi:subtilisin